MHTCVFILYHAYIAFFYNSEVNFIFVEATHVMMYVHVCLFPPSNSVWSPFSPSLLLRLAAVVTDSSLLASLLSLQPSFFYDVELGSAFLSMCIKVRN